MLLSRVAGERHSLIYMRRLALVSGEQLTRVGVHLSIVHKKGWEFWCRFSP